MGAGKPTDGHERGAKPHMEREMAVHRHRAISAQRYVRGFFGPVASPEVRAAHGNVCCIDVCTCGAVRRTNTNGNHAERGPWVSASEMAPSQARRYELGVES